MEFVDNKIPRPHPTDFHNVYVFRAIRRRAMGEVRWSVQEQITNLRTVNSLLSLQFGTRAGAKCECCWRCWAQLRFEKRITLTLPRLS